MTYEKSVLMYEKDGLYGLITYNGKEITKPIYNSIENLRPTEGKFLVSKDGKYGCIDLNGNTLVKTDYDKVESDEYYTEEDGYKKSGFIVCNKESDGYKYGYINFKGKEIIEAKYSQVNRIQNNDGLYLIISENGKYGLYKENKRILDSEYQNMAYEDKSKLLILQKNKKYGVSTLDGKLIIDIKYDTIEEKGMYLYTTLGENYEVYDTNGKNTNMDYNRCLYETENENYRISTFLKDNITYYGLVDKSGDTLVDETYRYLEYIYKNYFIATNNEGKMGIIDDKGNTILEMKYKSLQKIKGKNIIQAVEEETNLTQIYSENMKKTAEMNQPNIQNQEEYVMLSNENEKVYLDKDGNVIQDISKIKQIIFPDKIGEYSKKQITIEDIYYSK